MKKSFFIVCAALSIMGCAEVTVQDVPEVDNDDAVEVAFEDVTTDVRIVPLISDDPIGACNELHCYGNEVLMSDRNGEYIYYFVDGKLKSTLHAVGRGPGEYTSIGHFTYSPTKKLLLVSAIGDINEYMESSSSMVMKFTVPDMKFVGKIPIEGKIASMSCQDGDKILAITAAASLSISDLNSSLDTSRVILADIETGQTITRFRNVPYYEYLQGDIMQASGPNLTNVMCASGFANKLYRYQDGKQQFVFAFTFREKNIPQEFLDPQKDPQESLMGLLEFMMSNPDNDCLEGGFWPIIDGDRYSFWYHKVMEQYRDHFYRYENGKTVNYRGFRAKGTNIPFVPKAVDGTTYVTIMEGTTETLFSASSERSSFTAELEKTMNAQNLNNPVLVYYKIK